MKKVWVLEGFYSREEMLADIEKYENDLVKYASSDDASEQVISAFNNVIQTLKNQLFENPEGRWVGYEGKVYYKQFCNCAIEAIKRHVNKKFRVVEGEIEDDAKYWNGYKIIKENDGVLRYLMYQKKYY